MKKWKQIVSLLLVVLLAVSIGACGAGNGSSASVSKDGVVEVNVWAHDMDFPAGDRLVAYVEEKFGLKFNFTSYPWGQYQENLRVELGAGNVPDMFPSDGPGDTNTMYDQLYNEGLLLDMTDVIGNYPNLEKNMHYDDAMLYSLQNGDKLYGIPRIWNKDTTDRVFMIRKDWLDDLGLEMPKTWDDLRDVLQA
ncbi:MAG: extracellular solute-binding protein, partial [Oscillospiraceae bacterium]